MPEPASTLGGLRVLVTRPVHQADQLCGLLAARGAEVVRLPLQSIEPARQPALALKPLQASRDFDAWIFTSANAVRFAAQLDSGVWPARLIGVGAATASALQAAGRDAAAPTAAFSSEGLLAAPFLQDVSGWRVLIVRGSDGLNTLAEELARRGATVDIAEVYRRVPLPHTPETVQSALRGTHAIVVTSAEALAHLVMLTPETTRGSLMRKQLVVPSQRVVEKARALGFAEPLVAEQVADAAFVRSLESWRAAQSPPSA
jgi:uroporphyrinogen-III synthase